MQMSEEGEVLLEMSLTRLGFISSRFQKNLPASAGTGFEMFQSSEAAFSFQAIRVKCYTEIRSKHLRRPSGES